MSTDIHSLSTAEQHDTLRDLTTSMSRVSGVLAKQCMSVANMIAWSVRAHSDMSISPIVQLITSMRRTKDRVTTGTPGLEPPIRLTRYERGKFRNLSVVSYDLADSVHFGGYPAALAGGDLAAIKSTDPLGGSSISAAVNASERRINRAVLARKLIDATSDSERGDIVRPYFLSIMGSLLNFRQYPATGWRTSTPDEIRAGLLAVFSKNTGAFSDDVAQALSSVTPGISLGQKMVYAIGPIGGLTFEGVMDQFETRHERDDGRRGRTFGTSAFNAAEFFDKVINDPQKFPAQDMWSTARDLANIFDFEPWIPEVMMQYIQLITDVLADSLDGLTSNADSTSAEVTTLSADQRRIKQSLHTLSTLNALFTLTK